jgi:hypothetical protein
MLLRIELRRHAHFQYIAQFVVIDVCVLNSGYLCSSSISDSKSCASLNEAEFMLWIMEGALDNGCTYTAMLSSSSRFYSHSSPDHRQRRLPEVPCNEQLQQEKIPRAARESYASTDSCSNASTFCFFVDRLCALQLQGASLLCGPFSH